jgi:hypothetical protein
VEALRPQFFAAAGCLRDLPIEPVGQRADSRHVTDRSLLQTILAAAILIVIAMTSAKRGQKT